MIRNILLRKSFIYAIITTTVIVSLLLFYKLDQNYQLKLKKQYSYAASSTGYVVSTSQCKIPDVDPYDESIRPFIHAVDGVECSDKQPLTYIKCTFNHNLPTYKIVINMKTIYEYVSRKEELNCCYSIVSALDEENYDDNYYRTSECRRFSNEVALSGDQEYVYVKCWKNVKFFLYTQVYANIHAVVPVKKIIRNKYHAKKKPSSNKNNKISILLIGIDSMSRLNMLRTMPRTVAILKNNSWIEFVGYNKVGDNTLPNLLPVLTGTSYEKIRQTCMSSLQQFDNCPFIWKNFSKQDYVTLYMEDEPYIGTFHFEKPGFKRQPTDYYFRPYMLASYEKLTVKKISYMTNCLGPSKTTSRMLNYLFDFAKIFKNTPYFGMMWMNHIAHDDQNVATLADQHFEQFFQNLHTEALLNNSIVIFLSDHGIRFGEIRKTYIGWLEERLPFLYVWIPLWFRKSYLGKYRNLQKNSNQLISPYDIHRMLVNVLQLSSTERFMTSTESHENQKPLPCDNCIDLFSENTSRSCKEAGIPHNFCACTQYKTFPTDNEKIKRAGLYIVDEVRALLKNPKMKYLYENMHCANLFLNRILSARIQTSNIVNLSISSEVFVVIIETLPSEAVFEATVEYEQTGKLKLLGSISRINSYSNQSICVDEPMLKAYCYCVSTQ